MRNKRRFIHWIFARGARGFTLIELILGIIILGFVSLIMIPLVNSIRHSPDPAIRQRGIALGQALMDEILAKKWDENTPTGGGPICTSESPDQLARPSLIDNCLTGATAIAALGSDGESRTDYDDVDDYNGLSSSDNFVDQNNASFSLPGYSRSATVDYIASNASPVSATSPVSSAVITDTKRIVVRVTTPRQENLTLVALLCNY